MATECLSVIFGGVESSRTPALSVTRSMPPDSPIGAYRGQEPALPPMRSGTNLSSTQTCNRRGVLISPCALLGIGLASDDLIEFVDGEWPVLVERCRELGAGVDGVRD